MLKNIRCFCLFYTLILTACTNNNGTVNNSKITQKSSIDNVISTETSNNSSDNCKSKNTYIPSSSDNIRPIQITPSQKRGYQEFLNHKILIERLKKYNLYSRLEGTGTIGSTSQIGLFTPQNDDKGQIDFKLGSTGVEQIRYDFPITKETHDISDESKSDILQLINIIVNNNQKAHKLYGELYQQYQDNLKNNNILENNMVISDVEYNQRLFELQGIVYKDKNNPNCNISRIEALIIN